jgi:hypothetical protein
LARAGRIAPRVRRTIAPDQFLETTGVSPRRREARALKGALRAIEAYRSREGLWDLFRQKDGAVAVMTIDGVDIFGINSDSPAYKSKDNIEARKLRDTLVKKYPTEFFHRESRKNAERRPISCRNNGPVESRQAKRRQPRGPDLDDLWRQQDMQQLRPRVALRRIGIGESHGDVRQSGRLDADDAGRRMDR